MTKSAGALGGNVNKLHPLQPYDAASRPRGGVSRGLVHHFLIQNPVGRRFAVDSRGIEDR